MTAPLDLTPYEPSCIHYDTYLGVCGHPEGRWMACRKIICPKKKEES